MKIRTIRWYILALCMAGVWWIWNTPASISASGTLSVSFLDVGQGDSIFIESPNGTQVLVDGGIGRVVLGPLGKVMPFYDRDINLVIGTHPDTDHIGGLVEVLRTYVVDIYMAPDVDHDTPAQSEIDRLIEVENITLISASSGQAIDLGGGAFLYILFPHPQFSSAETNDYSIVAKLVYGNTSILLTGDSTIFVESQLVDIFGGELDSDILKVGHHGSKTSTSEKFIDVVTPSYAIISAGCDNRYGHPDESVVERLQEKSIEILDTCEDGTIKFESDGNEWFLK